MRMNKEQLEREFACPKCHGRGAVVQEVNMGRAVARMLSLPPTRYLAASCGLCGYTEFYQMAIAEKAAEQAPQNAKLAEKPE